MEFFRIRKDIPFMRHALVLNVISFLTFGRLIWVGFTFSGTTKSSLCEDVVRNP